MTIFEGSVNYSELRRMPLPELRNLMREGERIRQMREKAQKK
jgi:hypothetical protein